MIKILSHLILVFFSCGASAQSWEWSFPTHNLENLRTVIASNNEIFLAANFSDSCKIKTTPLYSDSVSNVVIAKLSAEGDVMWTKVISGHVKCINIAAENNDLVVALDFSKHITGDITLYTPRYAFAILRITNNGTLLNTFVSGQGLSVLRDMALLPDGGILVGGLSGDTITLGGNTFVSETGGGYFAKFDNSYNLVFYKDFIAPGPTVYFQLLRVGKDDAGNLYIEGDFGDSVKIASDTTVFFSVPFSNLLKFSPGGQLLSFHPSNTYFPHMKYFSPCDNGAYNIELWEDGSCNHCNTGLIIRKTADSGTDDWIYQYEGSNVYSSPDFSIRPGGLAVTPNEIYFTAEYYGEVTLGSFHLNSSGKLIIKMDHLGNYISVDSVHDSISVAVLSNMRNGAIIVSGRAPYPSLYGTVSKYRDTLATHIKSEIMPSLQINVYPNPSTGIFIVRTDDDRVIDNLDIYDSAGKHIYSRKFSSQLCSLDINDLDAGFYTLAVHCENMTCYKKLLLNNK